LDGRQELTFDENISTEGFFTSRVQYVHVKEQYPRLRMSAKDAVTLGLECLIPFNLIDGFDITRGSLVERWLHINRRP
jgi:hypothetical protein